ncbi:hypothetical protein F1880_004341 [Penicillium rolfsii]|nr:hypothetical protein F1880_004341 [Penicillium rolfsii]
MALLSCATLAGPTNPTLSSPASSASLTRPPRVNPASRKHPLKYNHKLFDVSNVEIDDGIVHSDSPRGHAG